MEFAINLSKYVEGDYIFIPDTGSTLEQTYNTVQHTFTPILHFFYKQTYGWPDVTLLGPAPAQQQSQLYESDVFITYFF